MIARVLLKHAAPNSEFYHNEYYSSTRPPFVFCRAGLGNYFNISNWPERADSRWPERVTLVLSTVRPTDDDEYYVISRSIFTRCWRFSSMWPNPPNLRDRRPWTYTFDDFLCAKFEKLVAGEPVYVWMEEA